MSKRVLFVDDERMIRLTLPEILRKEGFEVTVAATVAEALQHINTSKFDVLLSDLNIGEPGDGFTVVSAMRRLQPNARTLILTGYPDFETALTAIRKQVDDYIVKPADISTLVAYIKRNSNAERHEPLQAKNVSTMLRDHRKEIIHRWMDQVEAHPSLSAIRIGRQERIDHAPEVLEQIALDIESGQPHAEDGVHHSAVRHGRTRFAQGYSLPMMITEARLLERTIARVLQENLLAIDLSSLIADIFLMGDSFRMQVEESVRAYEIEKSQSAA